MLGKEDSMVIQALVKRGVYLCDIARQLGVHPKTVEPDVSAWSGAESDAQRVDTSAGSVSRAVRSAAGAGRLERCRDPAGAASARFPGRNLDRARYMRPKRALWRGRAGVLVLHGARLACCTSHRRLMIERF